MANFSTVICLLLTVFVGPHTCRAQGIIMGQVYRLLNEIDTMVKTVNVDAAAYVIELEGLFENLNTSASTDLESFSSTVNDLITSVQSEVADIVANANETDVSECTDSATSVISRASEILEILESCISREIVQAESEVALQLPYVNSQLITLASFQTFAQNCVARFNESEETASDGMQAFACVQPLHRSAQLLVLRFELIIDIELAEDLFNGYEARVANCISTATSELESLFTIMQDVCEKLSTCVADAIESSF